MVDTCFLCGRTPVQVAEYLSEMMDSYKGRSFDGLVYGPFQHCLDCMKSLMYLRRKLEQRTARMNDLEAKISRLESEGRGHVGDLKLRRSQLDSVGQEVREIQDEIDRKQRDVDVFMDVQLEDFQTRNGYIIRLCPVCMGLVSSGIVPDKRDQ